MPTIQELISSGVLYPNQRPVAPTWQPTQGMNHDQWKADQLKYRGGDTSSVRYGSDGRQLHGTNGLDPQELANFSAIQKYGAGQGWVQPHQASWGGVAKGVAKTAAPFALAALGGGLAAGAFGGAAGAGTGIGAGTAGGLGGGSTVGSMFGGAATTGGGLAGTAGGIGGGVGAAGLGTGVGVGAGYAGTGLGLGMTTGSAAAPAVVNSGLNSVLNSVFGTGASTASKATTLGMLGQVGMDFYTANQRGKAGDEAASLADPFASQRGQYQGQLQQHMTNPSSFMDSPMVQNSMDAMAKKMAAMGYNLSPAQADEMRKAAMNQHSEYAGILGNLAGAQFGPGQAGQLSLQGNENKQAQQYQGMADIGTLIGGIYDNYSKSGGNPTMKSMFGLA